MAISSLSPPPPPPPPPPHHDGGADATVNGEDKTTLMNTDDENDDETHEENPNQQNPSQQNSPKSSKHYTLLLTANIIVLVVGSVAATLITKFYFIHNGNSRWVSTWIQTAGFPLLLPPILLLRRKSAIFSGFTPRLALLSLAVGVFLGVSNLLFSWGTSYLPVSTSSLLLSSQLAFNLILSAAIAKQKVKFNNLNCVILLTLGSILLALSASSDRPPQLTRRKYLIGFFSTLGAGISFAVYLPVMEVIYREVKSYAMVVEMQLLMGIAATAFASAGMAADGGFADLRSESSARFDRGSAAYWWTIGGCAAAWQMSFVGTAGMVYLTTSLTGGICMTALLAVNVGGGVVVYGDEFGGVKAVATVLCVWGFCSYLYGMYAKREERRRRRKRKRGNQRSVEMSERQIMV